MLIVNDDTHQKKKKKERKKERKKKTHFPAFQPDFDSYVDKKKKKKIDKHIKDVWM